MQSRYTPYHRESADYARTLCIGITSPLDKYRAVTKWVGGHVFYDHIRASSPDQRKVYPDIEYTWSKGRGICLDTAALTVNMLRAVGVTAYVAIGYANTQYHAWVEATIDGKTYLFDHQALTTIKKITYKRERVYG